MSDAQRPPPRRALVWALAALFAVVTFLSVAVAQRRQGIARDEVVYFNAGAGYARWWIDLFTGVDGTAFEPAITARFGGANGGPTNPEHPPLMKTLFGLSAKLLHDELGWASRVTANRLPTAALHGLLIALVLLYGASAWGLAEGILAALFTLLLPRLFFHAGLACFDAPIAALWFATLCAYRRALHTRFGFLLAGVVFGLALATKHNAVLLPVALIAHYAWVSTRGGRGAAGLASRRVLAVAAPLLLGPVVLVLLWPWLWFAAITHARAWIGFHLHHVHYNYEYLGQNWNAPRFPWHVSIVTTLFTVPTATLAAAAAGAALLVARWRRPVTASGGGFADWPGLLLFLSAGVSMGPFLLGSTPIFGAEKHWAPAMPTICAYAGVGVVALARRAAAAWRGRPRWAEPAAIALLGALVGGAALVETVTAQPYALSHYTALAGGAPGGADRGMNRQFWGYAARGVLPWLNAHAPAPGEPPRRVYSHDAQPAWSIYMREGLLARGLPDSGREADGVRTSQIAIVIHELHFNRHDYMIWSEYGTVQPAFVLTTHGVPIVSVYLRPAR